ncbi:LPS O-antigen chain length determinant protein WzzB [Aeromonas enteropelogenes]|uniref:LPS O-antigen chain length determinant protein WzzB n=1 Tax=Aeromonas enteropelogenes TaxID=29489 RepID=UPI001CCDE572|nr:Wzz/FepE/Etk N-terminal domain-containing protein [Aeromonas enteropelogenes]UBH29263.1 hypothetical protein LA358_08610 [Aeromonas enteropelogenes]
MTDNTNIPPSTPVPQGWQAAPQNEIDGRELVLVLWRQKIVIILVTLVFALAGVAYALLAPQVWSVKAVIIEPKSEETLPLRQVASRASELGLDGFPNGKALYDQFLLNFNVLDNQRAYLRQTPQFKAAVQELQLDARGQRMWVNEWIKLIAVAPVDKKGEKPGTQLTLSASSSSDSLAMLKGYIDYLIAIQRAELIANLESERALKLSSLQQRYDLLLEDTQRSIAREITTTSLSDSLARAAGVTAPLVNYNQNDAFPITLGTKGLQEKLALLKSIDVAVYQPKLADMKVQMARLQQVSLDKLAFRPFSYMDEPHEPMTRDKPKRPLVVVLATLLGVMLGVGIVLVRHAFRRPEDV